MLIQEAIQEARKTQTPDENEFVAICLNGQFVFVHCKDNNGVFWCKRERPPGSEEFRMVEWELIVCRVLADDWEAKTPSEDENADSE